MSQKDRRTRLAGRGPKRPASPLSAKRAPPRCAFALQRRARDTRGTGSLVAARSRSFRFQNGSGGRKDMRRVVVGDFSFGSQPVRNVAPELCTAESQRFATEERDRFGFHFPQMAGSVFDPLRPLSKLLIRRSLRKTAGQ